MLIIERDEMGNAYLNMIARARKNGIYTFFGGMSLSVAFAYQKRRTDPKFTTNRVFIVGALGYFISSNLGTMAMRRNMDRTLIEAMAHRYQQQVIQLRPELGQLMQPPQGFYYDQQPPQGGYYDQQPQQWGTPQYPQQGFTEPQNFNQQDGAYYPQYPNTPGGEQGDEKKSSGYF